jgi:maltose-binding protein MalE
MRPKTKKLRIVHVLLNELKARKILPNLFYYLVGAVGVLASVYEITDVGKIRTLFLVLCTTGAPIVIIFFYFHGKRGKNPIPIIEVILISICVLIGVGFAARILMKPTPITVLVRMMPAQESWFIENIIKEFEQENHCEVIIKRFGIDYELCEILRSELKNKSQRKVSLVKTPLNLTLLLYKEGLLKSYEDILSDLKFSKSEIESWSRKIEDEYHPVALKMSRISSITGSKIYYLPRKLETRLMIYRKSKVADAVKNWHKFYLQIIDILKRENGYGLPKNYYLEPDVNKWDYYDLFVLGYYWANIEYNGKKTARIAHRSKNYSGTVRGLIDRALQLGALKEDIIDSYRFSDGIVDMLHWEAIFRKYNLYCKEMWEGDGWTGTNLYEGIYKEKVYLSWLHQLDCLLIGGSEQLGIKGYFPEKGDFGIAIMPKGVSFELTKGGLPKRIGSKEAHTFGWFWGIPKNSPEPVLAYKLAMFITCRESHSEECKNFCILSVRKDVSDALKADLREDWLTEVHKKSLEQCVINGDHFVPRFKSLADYQEFLDNYYEAFNQIVLKRRFSPPGFDNKVDRDFIRENLK